MTDFDAAAAEVPLIDFDEGTVTIVARVQIAGELFDVPPMPAQAVAYFRKIKDINIDDARTDPWQLLEDFILRCLLPADQDRARNAIDHSSLTLHQLMEKGGQLIKAATGFPTSPPSLSAPSSPNGSASTMAGSLPAPAGPSSPAPPGPS